MAPTAEQQAARLRGVLGAEVAPHDRGGESRTFRTGDGALVTVGLDWPQVRREPCDVERECGLLAAVARVVAVAVPEVVDRVPDEGLVVVRALPGRRLLDVRADGATRLAAATAVARTLAELHASPSTTWADLAPVDATPPAEWRDEAAASLDVVRDALDSRQQAEAAAFLARPAPEPTDDLCFTHNDLGVEHVLVDPASRRVTGVIDWSDAAVTDPSVDLARLLRDLGPDALDHAVRVYRQHGGDPAPLLPRVGFYAVCGLVEDLTFGLLEARPAYVDKSLRLWDAVVGPVLAGG